MSENQSVLLQDAQKTVSDLLSNKLSETITFHTLSHTQEVVAACEKLADFQQLSGDDRDALLIAAWFHDTGYTGGKAKDHESLSVKLATDFLNAHQASEEMITKVVGCINATRMPQKPTNGLEGIICDADLFHLGTDEFREKNKLLRREFKTFSDQDISKDEWRKINIQFLQGHEYFTAYGKEKLQPVKAAHLSELKDKTDGNMKPEKKEKNKEKQKDIIPLSVKQEQAAEVKAKKDKEKDKQSERGVSTVFRIVAQNQNNLSGMADSKANILISVNSIILSIIIGSLSTKLDEHKELLLPMIVLVLVCVSAIVFSILATRPNVNHGTFTQEDIHNKKTNLLFFGNFYKMSLPDYDWAIQEMLADKDYLYASIAKDNYFLGVVLARKYKFLRYAYNIFMYGLIVAIVAFAISFMFPAVAEVYQ